MYGRCLNIRKWIEQKSYFLFGAWATGKTTLINNEIPEAKVFDLLNTSTFRFLQSNPHRLGELIQDQNQIVVIDEIQRIPDLLNEVQRLIQSRKIKFLLTGSSARKLKHGNANLLGGRARQCSLFPLISKEVGGEKLDFDIHRFLNHGGIPNHYDSNQINLDLEAYVDLYIREEIKAEALTRNVEGFSDFLDLMGRSNGCEINYESFASDLQISAGTLRNYIQILEDTLIGFKLPGFTETKKRKAITRSKFYLFDLGVARFLSKRETLSPQTSEWGAAFEHFIGLELRAYLSYSQKQKSLTYWRTTSQFEVDFLIGNSTAIEVKSTEIPTAKHFKSLLALKEEKIFKNLVLVYAGSDVRKTEDGIWVLPWKEFLIRLWQGDFD